MATETTSEMEGPNPAATLLLRAMEDPSDIALLEEIAKSAGDPDFRAQASEVDAGLAAERLQDVLEAFERHGLSEAPGLPELIRRLQARFFPIGGGMEAEDEALALLESVAGRAVLMDDLLWAGRDADVRFSTTVRDALRRATESGFSVELTDDPARQAIAASPAGPRRLVGPDAFLASLLDPFQARSDEGTPAAFLRDWLDGRSPAWRDDPRLFPAETTKAGSDASSQKDAVASPELTRLILAAARIARFGDIGDAAIIDARDMLGAMLTTLEGRQALADVALTSLARAAGGDPREALRDELGLLSAAVSEATQRQNAERRDRPAGFQEAWDNLFLEGLLEDPIKGLRLDLPLTTHLPAFDADDVARRVGHLAGDRLGVAGDARAIADLITLEQASPPLAIGLFGAWGSGKSTFMRMIEEASEENRERAARMREAGVPPPFVENVVHVWFNAWHYLDANLWASLVSHLFRELARQSREAGPTDWLAAAKVDALIRELGVAGKLEAEAVAERDRLKGEIEATRRTLRAIDARRETARGRLSDLLPAQLDPAARAQVEKALAEMGAPQAVGALDQLAQVAREAQSLSGRLKLVAASLARGDARSWASLAAGLVVFALGAGVLPALAERLWGGEWFALAVSRAGEAFALVGAAAAFLLPHVRRVNAKLGPLLDAWASAEAGREAAARAQARAEAEARRKLEQLEALQARSERELEAKTRERERLEAMARGERPADLLARFIEDRAQAEGYRRHLGLLSHIRRDFERMSAIMSEQRERKARGEPTGDLPAIDRIVLYIDDLDRCRDEQVVEVLEAIHLLLAFDLFVVVVGVDARWVEGALSRFYRRQLASGAGAAAAAAAGGGAVARPSVADYLEKIFQIPFRLKPLDHQEGGAYRNLVDGLVGPVMATDGAESPPAPPDGEKDDDADEAEAAAGEGAAAAPGDGAPVIRIVDIALPPRLETNEEMLERVILTRAELEAMQALGPIIGVSPRSVKRFVNLYRLLRSRRSGEALAAFLDDGREGPRFRLAMFGLALEVSGNAARLAQARRMLTFAELGLDMSDVLAQRTFLDDVPAMQPDADDADWKVHAVRFWKRFSLEEANCVETFLKPLAARPLADLQAEAAEASRYSFQMIAE